MHARTRYGDTAEVFLSLSQKIQLGVLAAMLVAYGVMAGGHAVLTLFSVAIMLFFALFAGIKVVVSLAGAAAKIPEDLPIPTPDDPSLPLYKVVIALYKEKERTVSRLLANLEKLDYPREKLLVALGVEKDDHDLIDLLNNMALPPWVRVVLVPPLGPRTKPKACNSVMGQIRYIGGPDNRVVLLDAEDRVRRNFLLRAVAALNAAHARDRRVVCVQGRLVFWNPMSGRVSPYYGGEYILHYLYILPGFARLGLISPLGGTSNHFYEWALWRVADNYKSLVFDNGNVVIPNIWDASNVTEDACLAMRLAKLRYRIVMDVWAVTYEEAPKTVHRAVKQKCRWLVGYAMSGLVHSRHPFRYLGKVGPARWFTYNLFMLGTPLALLLNPWLWATTLLYIVSRLAHWTSVTLYIESLFPSPWVYYPGVILLVVGNAFMYYQMLITGLREEVPGLVRRHVPTPGWWALTSYIAYRALYELVNPAKRYHWNLSADSHGDDAELEGSVLAPMLEAAPRTPASTLTVPAQRQSTASGEVTNK